MRIGIFGGTFNPVHMGHVHAVNETSFALGLDRVLMIPNALPPHKTLPENSPDANGRLEMLRLCESRIKNCEISNIEIRRGGRSYTIETLNELAEIYKNAEFWLIMGGDMFAALPEWYLAGDILSKVSVAVLDRSGERERILDFADVMREKYEAKVRFIEAEPVAISSTELRQLLKERGGTEFLSPEVYSYIIKHGLYGALPDFRWLLEKSLEYHEPNRRAHVLGTEAEAVKLAGYWGVNIDDARTAAILHDVTKKLSLEEQLKLCEDCGIVTDVVEKMNLKLLHAKTGAEVARREFHVSNEVYEAIYWHTTGKPGMSGLEKIIYLADYIEPGRDFSGIDDIRRLAYTDMDKAVAFGISMTLDECEKKGQPIHQKSVEALEFLKRNIL